MRILVIGCLGKMGKELTNFLLNNNQEVVGIDANSRPNLKQNRFDAIVDFSCADALSENLKLALKLKTPLIVATTGHTQENLNLIKETTKKLPVFMSSNFSLGFFAVKNSLSAFSNLTNYDFEIVETHHKQKKDAPSGSALTLQNTLKKHGINSSITSIRTGHFFGEHKILICGENETIEIKHTALSRKLFCEGAFEAIKFLVTKQNGLYTMEDLFNDNL